MRQQTVWFTPRADLRQGDECAHHVPMDYDGFGHDMSGAGNFVTDIMLEAVDADVALLNAGTLRSDAVHPTGSFRLKDLVAIFPMIDFLIVLRISGNSGMLLFMTFCCPT